METAVEQRSIFSVIVEGISLWLRSFPRLLFLAVILVGLTTLFAIIFFAEVDPTAGLIVSFDKADQHWWALPFYFIIPYMFFAIMFHQVNRVAHREKNITMKASFVCPADIFLTLLMAMIFSALVIVASFIFFVIPGIIFTVILQFYIPVIVFEKRKWYEGFWRTCDLVWGRWWRSTLVLFIPLFIFLTIIYWLHRWAHDFLITSHITNVLAYQLTVHTILSSVYITLIISMIYVQYCDLVKHANDPDAPIDRSLKKLFSVW